MNRPKLRIEKKKMDKSIEFLTFFLIVGSVILIGVLYGQLPEKVPIHFNWPSKDKNGFGTKDLLWASPVITGILGMGIYQLTKYPRLLNYPVEIKAENAAYTYRLGSQMLRVLNLAIGLICFFITLSSVLDGLQVENNLAAFLSPLYPVLLIGIPVIFLIKMGMKQRAHNREAGQGPFDRNADG